jgi:hypothetical protein
MHRAYVDIDQVKLDTPVRLNVAAALAFPDGSITAAGLRGETALVKDRLARRCRSTRAKIVSDW